MRSLSLELGADAPACELVPLGRGDYADVARAYRAVAERRGLRAPRAVDARTLGAPVLRLEGEVHADGSSVLHTFDDVLACARHWREDLALERARVLVGGWNRGGYDGGHPDVLPANAACGGDAGLARCARGVRALGYLFGLHDNYQDLYEDAPSWDPELVALDEQGAPRAGGVWGGGQSWMICTTQALAFAQRNLPRVVALAQPDFLFLDTTLTTRLQPCTHAAHPMTAAGDRAARLALFDFARAQAGGLGLEGVREWAVPHADFLEGVMTHRTVHGESFTAVPLFPIVYGDQVDLLTVQADRLRPDRADAVLDHLVYGELPMVEFGAGRYWEAEPELDEALARTPAATFARGDHGWARGLAPTDRLLKNVYELLGGTHRAIAGRAMDAHRFLDAAGLVEQSVFGDVRVTANYGDAPWRVGDTVLGRYGFLVESPRFTAFHALERGGVAYPTGACFALQTLDAGRGVRVFHAFGDARVRVGEAVAVVEREQVVVDR
ncbi:MAG: hypothetical protein H6828_13370 [Planctomycetes bacterium]|nr:hypothetical protein [Planctomycetota bacterium]